MLGVIKNGRLVKSGRSWLAAVVAAVVSVLAGCPAAALASSPVPDWTKQAPANHPPRVFAGATAYDAATRTVVLFGGFGGNGPEHRLGATWTWDGTTWTRQHAATSPSARSDTAMAYDAATGTVVLYGGYGGTGPVGGTWTWDGTTWTKQAPATSPTPLWEAAMAYDPATGTVVLFGGGNKAGGYPDATWTWNGTTWTKQAPATSPPICACKMQMVYDAATGTVDLLQGSTVWTWDGSTWTQQHPATSPPARTDAAAAYDAATATVVLFSGMSSQGRALDDTWTWDGSTWTQQHPATSPPFRTDAVMAYDAATGTVVLLGGLDRKGGILHDTWTWG